MNIKEFFSRDKELLKDEEFFDQLEIHKRNKRIRRIVIALILLVVIVSTYVYEKTRVFKKIRVISTVEIQNGFGSKFTSYGDMLIKYSEDGASYIDRKQAIWNQAFEMKTPIVDICGDYVVVAEQGGTEIYLFDEDGLVIKTESKFPIVKVEVAKQGVVAMILEDARTNYIELIDKEGNQLVTSKTDLASNGYPLEFSLSDDGTKLAVSYLYVSGGVMQSKVLFYNFSDVGQNEVDRMVGGFNQYSSTVVPTVEFLDNDECVCIGDNIITLYSMKQKPSIAFEEEITEEIEKVCYSSSYVGLVLKNTDTQHSEKNKVVVYNKKGKEVMSEYIDDLYDEVKIVDDCIFTYNKNDFKVLTFKGKERFKHSFNEDVVDIIPISLRTYYVITNDKVKCVKLK